LISWGFNMSAFGAAIGRYVLNFVLKYILNYVHKGVLYLIAAAERNIENKKQDKKDAEQIDKTREAVKNGTDEDIEKETEKMLNG